MIPYQLTIIERTLNTLISTNHRSRTITRIISNPVGLHGRVHRHPLQRNRQLMSTPLQWVIRIHKQPHRRPNPPRQPPIPSIRINKRTNPNRRRMQLQSHHLLPNHHLRINSRLSQLSPENRINLTMCPVRRSTPIKNQIRVRTIQSSPNIHIPKFFIGDLHHMLYPGLHQ